ncbi:MAG: hypothetical protein LBF49_00585 [Puniceicoccales bacterium]|nr:hypothetical protein [Puniceicoccales bacterium]
MKHYDTNATEIGNCKKRSFIKLFQGQPVIGYARSFCLPEVTGCYPKE